LEVGEGQPLPSFRFDFFVTEISFAEVSSFSDIDRSVLQLIFYFISARLFFFCIGFCFYVLSLKS